MPKNSKIISKQLHQKLLIAYGKIEDVDHMVDDLTERGNNVQLRNDLHLRRIINDIRLASTQLLNRIEQTTPEHANTTAASL